MKILVVTSTFPRWSGDTDPTFVYELCARLADGDTEVHILAPHTRNAQVSEQVDGIIVHRFRYFFERWENLAYSTGILDKLHSNRFYYLLVPFFLVGMTYAIVRLVHKEKFSVVHAHWLIPQGFACATAFLLIGRPPPLVCTSHGGDLFGLRGFVATTIKKWVVNRTHTVTVVSSYMRNVMVTSLRPKLEPIIMSMGVDLSTRFVPLAAVQRSPKNLIFVGRLVEKKGVSYLLQAMSLLLNEFPDIHLTVVGDGPHREKLESEANTLAIENNLTFLGSVTQEQLPALYSQSAIAVVPSVVASSGDQEGLGLVSVEALGCGCAVVASDLPAIRDVVEDFGNGLLAKVNDAGSLAERIGFLLRDPERLLHYQLVGRKSVVDKFDWIPVAKNYRKLLAAASTTTDP